MDFLPVRDEPNGRKAVGMALIVLLIVVWAAIVATIAGKIGFMAWPLQALFYAVAGIAWILPLKPLLRWMELGKWRE